MLKFLNEYNIICICDNENMIVFVRKEKGED